MSSFLQHRWPEDSYRMTARAIRSQNALSRPERLRHREPPCLAPSSRKHDPSIWGLDNTGKSDVYSHSYRLKGYSYLIRKLFARATMGLADLVASRTQACGRNPHRP